MSSEGGIVYGVNPVFALLSQVGGGAIEALYLLKGGRNPRVRELMEIARAAGVKFRLVDRATLDRLTGGGVHQGVAARSESRRHASWDELLGRLPGVTDPLLVILDGVQDPQNLGAVMRSAEVFGALAVIQPRDRSAPLSPAAEKAAAGAAARIDLVRVTNLARAIDELKDLGILVFGLDGASDTPLYRAALGGGVALVLGGEEKGLRRLTREKCDQLLAIPMIGEAGSLNVSVAAGAALYEATRQRMG